MSTNEKLRFENLAGGAGKQTMLKSTLRGLIDLLAISDRKANILLSINAIILSVVISFAGYDMTSAAGQFTAFNIHSVPLLILLLTCLVTSLIVVYVVNPKHIQKHDEDHLGVFMLARKYTDLDAYLDQMATILKSDELIYQNITTDIHSLSSFLIRKNITLWKAYLAFFIGILISVGSFVIIWLTKI